MTERAYTSILRADGTYTSAQRTNQASGRSVHVAAPDPWWAPFVIPAALVVIISVGMAFIGGLGA